MCGVLRIALYFFEFALEPKFLEGVADAKVVMAHYLLAVKVKGLVQSLAMCLAVLQNMHSLLSKHHFHTAGSNLLSLPRTNGTVVVDIELKDF